MYKYVQVAMISPDGVSHEQRKAYLRSLYGNVHERKKGMIYKFCGSIGFSPVISDSYSEFPALRGPEIESPESYVDPEKMLYDGLHVDLSKYGVIKFTVPIGVEEHPNRRYEYHREVICQQFAKFLEKVYPDLIITVFWLGDHKESVKDFVLNYIYQNLDFDDDIYTVECSSHRLLTDEEIEEIYKTMCGVTKYGWKINQFYCETCKKYNEDAPYHIMVTYDEEDN